MQIEKRVKALEKTVEGLTRRDEECVDRKWYKNQAGRFAGDPVFDEIVRLGRAYRKSQGRTRGSKGA